MSNTQQEHALPSVLVYDEVYKKHLTGPGAPEYPERCTAIMERLSAAPFFDQLKQLAPRAAREQDLLLCHEAGYLARAREDIESGSAMLSTGDTEVCPDTWEVALHAAGGVLTAVDEVVGGKAKNGFCVVRPPGHHATPSRGMGFCVFNNIAVGARYAQRELGLEKVAIVDWDVHHGNGTQDIFYEDPSVFFFSTHQSPWYPGTGAAEETGKGKGLGTTLNCPFPAGAGREEIYGAFQDRMAPQVQKFKPDLVLISAGFDSRIGDPLGHFKLTDVDFADLTRLMRSLADECCGGRVVSVLEGGYNLDGLAKAAEAHCGALVSAD